ncbi:glycoside hydrolase family 127 protein [Paludibaculum fermentans]|uniref:Glycoside hydrolase family 127 protein n=1 Tax=Paludibaculum fermentans TaxID=1473598 RepID=A0A7S7SJE8_PALFE|nr:glycoside hydrolase family 127 protein [Paludibaculum fermentans]QOY86391.1 glycoside hydrolase family 127 protein [Paludibaculum fermentans]
MQASRTLLAIPAVLSLVCPVAAQHDYPVKPVPFTAVHVNDVFWAPRIEVNRAVTIPFAFEKCEETDRVENFIRAAKALQGQGFSDKIPGFPFDDTDIYKVLEGASYALSVQPDPKLDAYLDTLIAHIAAAQEPDGYLYTARTMNPDHPHKWSSPRRWESEGVDSHELYNLGHLYEAAAAHYQATGKRNLLDIALKTADLLDRTFGPGKQAIWPGHQITEMGLVKLYRITGEERYLKLAKFLLDTRGPGPEKGGGREYNQSHVKVVDQTEAVGHAVRATYMYSGMADVAAMTGDTAYVQAIDRIWENVVSRKLYITGGIGATGAGEAFGKAYELPNMSAYNETCAAIGNDYWNHRLFLLHADAKYIDVMERTLYNGLISGVSLDGKTFFYPNPLESNGQHARSPWFGCACCPGNITRFLASLPGYMYAQHGSTLYVNLFAASSAGIDLEGVGKVKVTQQTRYPWEGAVKLTVEPARQGAFSVNVRIPGWARGEAVPSDLYRFAEPSAPAASIKVNGQPVPMKLVSGYVALDRTWRAGDVIELNLPMPIRRVLANDQVAADRGRVALQRGPLVYTAEWPDNPEGRVRNLVLPVHASLAAEFKPELLGGVTVIRSTAQALAYDAQGRVTRKSQPFTAIPYFAWANRGKGQMTVWLPVNDAAARPLPYPTVATTSRITTSGKKDPKTMIDGEQPESSSDPSSYFDWWPTKGTTEWVELAFEKTATVSESQIYWFDDTGHGEVRVPASWRLLYKKGDAWVPVEGAAGFGTARDTFNRITFQPVTTQALRLEVTLQPNWSAGLQEWKVR